MNERRGNRERVAILLNPSAGRGRAGKNRDRLARLFQERGLPYELHVTENEAHLRQLAREKAQEFGVLAAAGGDSTFQIVAEEIVRAGAGARLAMFGLGSSNDITREFGLDTLEKSATALAEGRTHRIDLGCVESDAAAPRYFIGQASIGLGVFVNQYAALVASRRPALAGFQNVVGFWGIRRAFRKGLVPISLVVESPGLKVRGRFQVANLANIRFWATGRKLVPQARPDDGMLDACLISEGSFLRLARLNVLIKTERHLRSADVVFVRSQNFVITAEEPFAIQVDGEILGGVISPSLFKRIQVRVVPGALTITA